MTKSSQLLRTALCLFLLCAMLVLSGCPGGTPPTGGSTTTSTTTTGGQKPDTPGEDATPTEEVTRLQGTTYPDAAAPAGAGASLAADIGVTRKEAGQYIKNYFEKYSGISEYLHAAVESARALGYVETIFGRRRYIPELTSSKAAIRSFGERVAMNSPIQGSSADIIKLAMINVRKALKDAGLDARLILQIHDELIVEASEQSAKAAAEILEREMENVVHLSVPLIAETSTGKSWFECK